MKTGVAICLLALPIALGACGSTASSGKGGGPTGAGGSSSTGAGGSGGMAQCQVNILPISPPSFDGLTAGPASTLRVRGQITGLPAASFSWSWQVTFADGSPIATTAVGGDPAVVDFPLATAGTYTMAVQLVGAVPCVGRRTVTAAQLGGKLATFRFRFTPPPDGEPPQDQEIQIIGGTPSGGNVVVLAAGTLVNFDPRDETMQPVPAYVRLSDPTHRLTIEARRATGAPPPVLRVAPGTYDMLVIPDDALAPVLMPAVASATLANMGPLPLAKGVMVAGTVSDGAGPVVGASVSLRAGELPSTLATTAAGGAFTLRAAPGTYAATVARPLPPAVTGGTPPGMLEATLPAATGVTVTAAGAPALAVQIAGYTTATLNMQLSPNDKASGLSGTRVLIESASMAAATVMVGGQARTAPVRVRGELAPDATGVVSVAGLPRAHYRVTVVPPSGASDAITPVADLDLSTGDLPRQTVALRRKVPMTGKLLPGNLSGGLALTAIDITGDLPIAIPSVTDAQGLFNLVVNPERTYRLRVQPGPERMVAPAVFGPLTVAASGLAVDDHRMPSALLYAGKVVDHFATNGSPATLIQVYCLASAADCADPETPVAETVTASDGTFQLRLPDPGVN